MKKLTLVLAAFGMAAMFTACGDDESSSPAAPANDGSSSSVAPASSESNATPAASSDIKSCDVTMKMSMEGVELMNTHVCSEGVIKTAEEQAEYNEGCQDQSAEEEGASFVMTATKGTGCPAGYVKKCEDAKENATHYYYDASAKNMSCEELASDDDDDMDF